MHANRTRRDKSRSEPSPEDTAQIINTIFKDIFHAFLTIFFMVIIVLGILHLNSILYPSQLHNAPTQEKHHPNNGHQAPEFTFQLQQIDYKSHFNDDNSIVSLNQINNTFKQNISENRVFCIKANQKDPTQVWTTAYVRYRSNKPCTVLSGSNLKDIEPTGNVISK